MRNIYLAYLLTIFRYPFFWLGVWVLYYLRFTDYTGIGLIEAIQITSITLLEIPSGALADIFGRKKTLIVSFAIFTAGQLFMGFVQNLWHIIISVSIISIGAALYSGTLESLLYDTMKQNSQTDRYQKVISNINSISLICIAITSIIGGFMYGINVQLPFIACGVFMFFGIICCLLLEEPLVETTQYNITSYLQQIKEGFLHLFRTAGLFKMVTLLLIFAATIQITYEILDYSLAIEFGFKEKELGILFSIVSLLSAGSSLFSYRLEKKFGWIKVDLILIFVFAISLLVSPLGGLLVGGTTIITRAFIMPIFNNITSSLLNDNIESKYRTTALSAFNMLKQLPYVLTALLIGKMTDLYSAATVAVILAILLVVLAAPQIILFRQTSRS